MYLLQMASSHPANAVSWEKVAVLGPLTPGISKTASGNWQYDGLRVYDDAGVRDENGGCARLSY